jgi:Tfp pilus assembly protein FimT
MCHAPAACLLEEKVSIRFKPQRLSDDAGMGLMEAIVGFLVTLIVCAVAVHLCRIGYARYRLATATKGIAQQLEQAREQAVNRRENVSVIFNARANTFGLDRNGNGKLDTFEIEELPDSIKLSEDTVVTFSRRGSLASKSKEPRIMISNVRDTRSVSVSSMGTIDID